MDIICCWPVINASWKCGHWIFLPAIKIADRRKFNHFFHGIANFHAVVPCSYHICIKLQSNYIFLDNTNPKNNPCWKAVLAMKKNNTNKGIYSETFKQHGFELNNTHLYVYL